MKLNTQRALACIICYAEITETDKAAAIQELEELADYSNNGQYYFFDIESALNATLKERPTSIDGCVHNVLAFAFNEENDIVIIDITKQ